MTSEGQDDAFSVRIRALWLAQPNNNQNRLPNNHDDVTESQPLPHAIKAMPLIPGLSGLRRQCVIMRDRICAAMRYAPGSAALSNVKGLVECTPCDLSTIKN